MGTTLIVVLTENGKHLSVVVHTVAPKKQGMWA